jgi:predicted nuclease of predicted toxin-antitoxin system
LRFLVDNALSPLLAKALSEVGHDATHVRDHGMQAAPDTEVFELAERGGRVLLSADTDFGTLLFQRGQQKPSLILFRRGASCRPRDQVDLLLSNLPAMAAALDEGAVAVFDGKRLRIRLLPFA